jgi:glc operon protein GlcG
MAADKLTIKKALNLEIAKQIAAAAEAEAKKNSWNVVITVVDEGGHLIYLQRMDEAQYASVTIATQKAQTAIGFKRPSKVFEDAIAGGRSTLLGLPIIPLEGGLPLVADGKMIGAVGVSGVTSQQDGVVAKAGVDAFARLAGP